MAFVAGEDQNSREKVVVTEAPDEGMCSLRPHKGSYLIGIYDKPLSFCGCGIGWFFFVFGFVFPPLWYYATVLYVRNQSLKDPRERAGLAASAIAALICSVVVLAVLFAVYYPLLRNS
ncbi:60S ribosomal protein L18a-like protein [Telopea speciosissima]|uniref:60S ribosomal protein L18a-like protein n=1 Tax=Telopea speciosissima TaxID=54955 RepID=UPI001CC45B8F|nr:60S ribosomal protein L18a-like protein [Telopea speciosissima]